MTHTHPATRLQIRFRQALRSPKYRAVSAHGVRRRLHAAARVQWDLPTGIAALYTSRDVPLAVGYIDGRNIAAPIFALLPDPLRFPLSGLAAETYDFLIRTQLISIGTNAQPLTQTEHVIIASAIYLCDLSASLHTSATPGLGDYYALARDAAEYATIDWSRGAQVASQLTGNAIGLVGFIHYMMAHQHAQRYNGLAALALFDLAQSTFDAIEDKQTHLLSGFLCRRPVIHGLNTSSLNPILSTLRRQLIEHMQKGDTPAVTTMTRVQYRRHPTTKENMLSITLDSDRGARVISCGTLHKEEESLCRLFSVPSLALLIGKQLPIAHGDDTFYVQGLDELMAQLQQAAHDPQLALV